VEVGHTLTENMSLELVMQMKSDKQVSEAMQFFNAYTRFMLAVISSTGVIVSILDAYLPG
jgi:hypothetical protein